MANETYINEGTKLKINGESDADYAWSVEAVANGAGRVSAQIDLGAAPRAERYGWKCSVQWQATPTQGGTLDLYKSGAPTGLTSLIDGDVGASDAAMGDVDMRRNMRFFGAVTSENAAASEACIAGGEFEHVERYLTLGAYNAGGATINATDSNFVFYVWPIYNVPGA